MAKGTMNRESYDLDMTCYFSRDDLSAGNTLQQLYDRVEAVLQERYWTERKTTALRLRSRDEAQADFHIDVVPGRYVDGKMGDVYLHRTTGDKTFLKTNLQTHIDHVKDSGSVNAIRLLKLWSVRYGVGIKTFALELLTIKLLAGRVTAQLADQLSHVLGQFRDAPRSLSIEDPANPHGNDLSDLLSQPVRASLESHARASLATVQVQGWRGVLGELPNNNKQKIEALRRMAVATAVRAKPYHIG